MKIDDTLHENGRNPGCIPNYIQFPFCGGTGDYWHSLMMYNAFDRDCITCLHCGQRMPVVKTADWYLLLDLDSPFYPNKT
jgi:hypothetical protein